MLNSLDFKNLTYDIFWYMCKSYVYVSNLYKSYFTKENSYDDEIRVIKKVVLLNDFYHYYYYTEKTHELTNYNLEQIESRDFDDEIIILVVKNNCIIIFYDNNDFKNKVNSINTECLDYKFMSCSLEVDGNSYEVDLPKEYYVLENILFKPIFIDWFAKTKLYINDVMNKDYKIKIIDNNINQLNFDKNKCIVLEKESSKIISCK
jgi:hypothetical protein